MSASLSLLRELPAGLQSSAELLARLDTCFLVGFGRLGGEQAQVLAQLTRVLSAAALPSPKLAEQVAQAVAAIERSEFSDRHFLALAAARAALQGAMHDALLEQACAALARSAPLPAPEPEAALESPAHHAVYLESVRHFLMELALAGFTQLDLDALLPFYATLEKLQAEPGLYRLAALLSGFLGELLAAMPIAAQKQVPVYRWVDLWSRAMLLGKKSKSRPRAQLVSGELRPLGCDLHHHPNLISVVVHALFTPRGGSAQLVRATVSAYKVDVIVGAEMWRLFDGVCDKLTRALRERLLIQIDGMTLLPGGDLLWDEAKATPGGPSEVFAAAALHLALGKDVARTALLGVDRHPAQLAEPVLLGGYKIKATPEPTAATPPGPAVKTARTAERVLDQLSLELAGTELPLAGLRVSPAAGLSEEHLRKSEQLIGLLRFDRGAWAVQPLALLVGKGAGKKPEVEMAGTPPLTLKAKDDTVAILRERAGKLLRAKS